MLLSHFYVIFLRVLKATYREINPCFIPITTSNLPVRWIRLRENAWLLKDIYRFDIAFHNV